MNACDGAKKKHLFHGGSLPSWSFSLLQGLIFGLGSLAVSTPYLGVILGLIIMGWLSAARSLNVQFEEADAATKRQQNEQNGS